MKCKCGEPASEGQTFCRQCGSRLSSRKRDSGDSIKLKRERPALPPLRENRPPSIRIPPPPEPQPPVPHPVGRSGSSAGLVAAGAAVLIIAAAAAAIWIQSMSTSEADPNSAGQGNSKTPGKVTGKKSRKPNQAPRGSSANPGASTQVVGSSSASSVASPTPSFGGAASTAGKRPLDGYVAQLGSFRDRKLADQRRSDVASRGTDAFVVSSSDYEDLTPGYWVVLSGPFDSEAEAEDMAIASGVPDAFVRRVSG